MTKVYEWNKERHYGKIIAEFNTTKEAQKFILQMMDNNKDKNIIFKIW